MKLTAKARYAVTAMADIAAFGAGAPVSLAEISERQVISRSFLEQLFRQLRLADLVTSHRGATGGYQLAHGADDIKIAQIVTAVDEPLRTTACIPGQVIGCRGTTARCLTHDLWYDLGVHIEDYLGSITLADVIAKQPAADMRRKEVRL